MNQRYWRVHFRDNGSIASVVPLTTVVDDSWCIVKAATEDEAKKKAFNLYCARKKKFAKERHHAKGECCCGRKQDRTCPKTGRALKTCSVCGEREKVYNERYNKRVKAGTVGQGMAERDEGARVEANLERQRDRRAEIRLEVLIECRDQWIKARNVGLYTRWIDREIEALTHGKKGAAA
jgi:hypothetical protein